jgi:drug/metabolite transporter (DMT)-like permease
MIALPLSILSATFLVLSFKYFERFGIRNLHAIVFNYITCVITGLLMSQEFPDISILVHRPWFPFAAFLGCCFFCVFNLMGYVANNVGVTVASVASKLSLVIPVIVAVFLYGDSFTILKGMALLLALIAVFLTSITKATHDKHIEAKGLVLAFIIFLSSGLNDSLVNYASVKLMNNDEFHDFNILIFTFASLSGVLVLLWRVLFRNEMVPFKAVIGGVILGVPNYFSLLFIIKALHIPGWNSSVIFPINNMGIVVLTAVCALILFKEKLLNANVIGIGLALAAILLLILE